MTVQAETVDELQYRVNDADEHSTPRSSAYEEYIDPDKKDMAIRTVKNDDGTYTRVYNGRPARFTFKNFQVVGSS
jgi:hypothetical protein